MAGFRVPASFSPTAPDSAIDPGTLCRQRSPTPGLVVPLKASQPDGQVAPAAPDAADRPFIRPAVTPIDDEPLRISDWEAEPEDGRRFVEVHWFVNFALPRRAARAGHLIQEVTRQLRLRGDAEPDPVVYYEAWSVRADHSTPNVAKERRYAKRHAPDPKRVVLPPGHDDFGGRLYQGTAGTFDEKGELRFYEGDLPEHLFKRHHHLVKADPKDKDDPGYAGNLPASPVPPYFWKHEKGVHRHFRVEWDLTGKDEDKWYVEVTAKIQGHHKTSKRRDWKGILATILGVFSP